MTDQRLDALLGAFRMPDDQAGDAPVYGPGGMALSRHIIVSRHPAAIEFIRAECPEFGNAPVVAQATPADVQRRIVAGNIPLHLAALATYVLAVEFDGTPPRGAEYTAADMRAAGARLAAYRVYTSHDAPNDPDR